MSTPGVPNAQQVQQAVSVTAGPNTAQPSTQGSPLLQHQVVQPSAVHASQVPNTSAGVVGQPPAAGNAAPTVGPAATNMPSSIPVASNLQTPIATPLPQQNSVPPHSSVTNVPPNPPAYMAMPNPGPPQNPPTTVPTNTAPETRMQQAAPAILQQQQQPSAVNPTVVQQPTPTSIAQPVQQPQQGLPTQSTLNQIAPQTMPAQPTPNPVPPVSAQPIGNHQPSMPASLPQPAIQPVLTPTQPAAMAPGMPSIASQLPQPVTMPMIQQQMPQQIASQPMPEAVNASFPGNSAQSAANHAVPAQNNHMLAPSLQHQQANLGSNGYPAAIPAMTPVPTRATAQPTAPVGNPAALPDLAAATAAAVGTIPNLASQMFQAAQNGSFPVALPMRVTGKIERVESQESLDSDNGSAKHRGQDGNRNHKGKKQYARKGDSSEEEEHRHDDRNKKDNRQQGQPASRPTAKPAKDSKDARKPAAHKQPSGNYSEDDQESYRPEDVVYSDVDERDDIRPKARDTQHRQRDKYEGDISTWGHKKMAPGFYSKKPTSESDYTMSSGLSPRDTRPRPRDFDVEAAKNTLAYTVGMYGRAQAMRREGTAPAAMGVADDLPTRMAYEQLNALSGMANKVQLAIDHNKRVFEARMKMEDTALTRKSFNAWRAARYGSVAKQQILLRACARIQRGTLSRAFAAWKDKFHQVDQDLAMRRKVSAVNARGRLRRAFMEWRRLAQERWWKNQYAMRDEQIHALERRIAGYERRPIMVLRKRKLSAVLNAWYNVSEGRRKRRQRFNKAGRYFQNQALAKSWNSWLDFCAEKARRRGLLNKAVLRMRNLQLTNAWNTWYDLFLDRREKQAKQNKCLRHWFNAHLNKAWQSWLHHVQWRKEKRAIMSRWKQPLLAKAFSGWSENVAWQKRMRLILKRAAGKLMNKTLGAAFLSWQATVEDSKMGEELNTKDQLLIKVKEMQEENERLRRDNERFVRLIDSGEWGRGRVAELVSAGEVLKGERDALLRLIQSMRKEYEAVQQAKVTQEDDMKALKDRMLLGGAARNKMLVKGASSFNALVRAMKQDLVEGGMGGAAAARNPNALYEIDKLSLDRVTVFPDGELNVEAVASMPATAAFSRPLSAGRAVRGNATTLGPNMAPPLQPVRMPQELIGSHHAVSTGPRPTSGPAGRSTGRFSGVPGKIASSGGTISKDYQRVLDALQSLTPAEVDKLENLVKQQAGVHGVGGGVPPGMHATSAPGSPGPHSSVGHAGIRR